MTVRKIIAIVLFLELCGIRFFLAEIRNAFSYERMAKLQAA